MSLVKAWRCDQCGMLVPAEDDDKEVPDGWLRIYWHKGGMAMEVNKTVCSGRCASKAFLAADEPKPVPVRKARKVKAEVTGMGSFPCPDCDKRYDLPQHLGMHRKRVHGTPSQRDVIAATGLSCPDCGQVYANRNSLGKHRRRVHR